MGYDVLQPWDKEDNGAIEITLDSNGNFRLSPGVVWAGYTADPPATKLLQVISKKTTGGLDETIIWEIPITDKGVKPYDLLNRYSKPGEDLVVRLPASGTNGTIGYLSLGASNF